MYVFDAPNSDYNYILFPFVQGVLPLDYLDATEEFKAHSILTNAKEIMAQFEVTFFIYFAYLDLCFNETENFENIGECRLNILSSFSIMLNK